jgi:DNA gyrase subunit B
MQNYGKPGKLYERGDDSELFVVEGDSAARALSQVRSPRTQAVLPMQGKPMNETKKGRRRS